MANRGLGLARLDGKVYFVHNCVPGDKVEAKIIKQAKTYALAQPIQYIDRSALHGRSPCSFFPTCGGCQWIDIDLDQQKHWKLEFLTHQMRDIPPDSISYMESPGAFEYRNRIQLQIEFEPSRGIQVGFFSHSSHELVAIDFCRVADPAVNAVIKAVTSFTLTNAKRFQCRIELQSVLAAKTSGRQVLATISERSDDTKILRQTLAELSQVAWCGFERDAPKAPFFLHDRFAGIDFHALPACFQQVNTEANRRLQQLVLDEIQRTTPRSMLDLFSGSGNLSLACSKFVEELVCVEEHPSSIRCGNHNIKSNPIPNATFIEQPVHQFLKTNKRKFDAILLDPPRSGIKEEASLVANMRPKSILYVSCDLMTLARDLGILKQHGYSIKKIHAMNFFPHTFHLENFVVLEQNNQHVER